MSSVRLVSIAHGIGTGPTTLAAFDAALRHAGIANFNLLILSSVIPAGSRVVESDSKPPKVTGSWGDRLYVVLAEVRVQERNMEAWAGLGWTQCADGRGLFVEHHGHSEAMVRADITATLDSMTAGRQEEFGPVRMRIAGTTCEDEPVCALVAAVYESQPWRLFEESNA